MDAHLVETEEAGAHYYYGGYKTFQPIEVSWAETVLVSADEFQEGNAPASEGKWCLVDGVCQAIPPSDWEVYIRSDSAAYLQDNLANWDNLRWKCPVSADMSPQPKEEVGLLAPQSWQMMEEKGGITRE